MYILEKDEQRVQKFIEPANNIGNPIRCDMLTKSKVNNSSVTTICTMCKIHHKYPAVCI